MSSTGLETCVRLLSSMLANDTREVRARGVSSQKTQKSKLATKNVRGKSGKPPKVVTKKPVQRAAPARRQKCQEGEPYQRQLRKNPPINLVSESETSTGSSVPMPLNSTDNVRRTEAASSFVNDRNEPVLRTADPHVVAAPTNAAPGATMYNQRLPSSTPNVTPIEFKDGDFELSDSDQRILQLAQIIQRNRTHDNMTSATVNTQPLEQGGKKNVHVHAEKHVASVAPSGFQQPQTVLPPGAEKFVTSGLTNAQMAQYWSLLTQHYPERFQNVSAELQKIPQPSFNPTVYPTKDAVHPSKDYVYPSAATAAVYPMNAYPYVAASTQRFPTNVNGLHPGNIAGIYPPANENVYRSASVNGSQSTNANAVNSASADVAYKSTTVNDGYASRANANNSVNANATRTGNANVDLSANVNDVNWSANTNATISTNSYQPQHSAAFGNLGNQSVIPSSGLGQQSIPTELEGNHGNGQHFEYVYKEKSPRKERTPEKKNCLSSTNGSNNAAKRVHFGIQTEEKRTWADSGIQCEDEVPSRDTDGQQRDSNQNNGVSPSPNKSPNSSDKSEDTLKLSQDSLGSSGQLRTSSSQWQQTDPDYVLPPGEAPLHKPYNLAAIWRLLEELKKITRDQKEADSLVGRLETTFSQLETQWTTDINLALQPLRSQNAELRRRLRIAQQQLKQEMEKAAEASKPDITADMLHLGLQRRHLETQLVTEHTEKERLRQEVALLQGQVENLAKEKKDLFMLIAHKESEYLKNQQDRVLEAGNLRQHLEDVQSERKRMQKELEDAKRQVELFKQQDGTRLQQGAVKDVMRGLESGLREMLQRLEDSDCTPQERAALERVLLDTSSLGKSQTTDSVGTHNGLPAMTRPLRQHFVQPSNQESPEIPRQNIVSQQKPLQPAFGLKTGTSTPTKATLSNVTVNSPESTVSDVTLLSTDDPDHLEDQDSTLVEETFPANMTVQSFLSLTEYFRRYPKSNVTPNSTSDVTSRSGVTSGSVGSVNVHRTYFDNSGPANGTNSGKIDKSNEVKTLTPTMVTGNDRHINAVQKTAEFCDAIGTTTAHNSEFSTRKTSVMDSEVFTSNGTTHHDAGFPTTKTNVTDSAVQDQVYRGTQLDTSLSTIKDGESVSSGVTWSSLSSFNDEMFQEGLLKLDEHIAQLQASLKKSG